jgi:putative flavoprotein involved in K+ transport
MDAAEPEVVAVIGAGPAGLAVAAALRPLGLRVRVLEQAEAPGWHWRHPYDRLHLHTTRRLSALPGLPIPAQYGRWVSCDDFVRYLEQYVQHHALSIELGTTVARVDRAPHGFSVRSSHGSIGAKYVIVCAGYNNVAFTPAWPGRADFTGELLHSHGYRNGERYRGKRVVVAGSARPAADAQAFECTSMSCGALAYARRCPLSSATYSHARSSTRK